MRRPTRASSDHPDHPGLIPHIEAQSPQVGPVPYLEEYAHGDFHEEFSKRRVNDGYKGTATLKDQTFAHPCSSD